MVRSGEVDNQVPIVASITDLTCIGITPLEVRRALRILDLQRLLPRDFSEIRSHIKHDSGHISPVRHADRKITYAASAKLHLLLFLNYSVFDQGEHGGQPFLWAAHGSERTTIAVF